jgi:hypothetical protein
LFSGSINDVPADDLVSDSTLEVELSRTLVCRGVVSESIANVPEVNRVIDGAVEAELLGLFCKGAFSESSLEVPDDGPIADVLNVNRVNDDAIGVELRGLFCKGACSESSLEVPDDNIAESDVVTVDVVESDADIGRVESEETDGGGDWSVS